MSALHILLCLKELLSPEKILCVHARKKKKKIRLNLEKTKPRTTFTGELNTE